MNRQVKNKIYYDSSAILVTDTEVKSEEHCILIQNITGTSLIRPHLMVSILVLILLGLGMYLDLTKSSNSALYSIFAILSIVAIIQYNSRFLVLHTSCGTVTLCRGIKSDMVNIKSKIDQSISENI